MSAQSDLWTWIASVILLDVLFGGAAAASTGRALARGWRPFMAAPVYMVPLAGAVGFLHYAIFGLSAIPLYELGDALWSLPSAPREAIAQLAQGCAFWFALTVALTGFAFAGYRLTRRRQMTERYDWLFERGGLWGWRERTPS